MPHRIVHFMGHGGQDEREAVLYFEKDNGDLEKVTSKQFMRRVRGTAFLVMLNACVSATPGPTAFSKLAAALVQQKIPSGFHATSFAGVTRCRTHAPCTRNKRRRPSGK